MLNIYVNTTDVYDLITIQESSFETIFFKIILEL